MDFGPMHPDVWANTDAQRFHYYSQLYKAYEDGREEVKHRRGNPDNANANMAKMIAKHTG